MYVLENNNIDVRACIEFIPSLTDARNIREPQAIGTPRRGSAMVHVKDAQERRGSRPSRRQGRQMRQQSTLIHHQRLRQDELLETAAILEQIDDAAPGQFRLLSVLGIDHLQGRQGRSDPTFDGFGKD